MSERRLSEIAKVLRQPEGIVGSEFTRINKAARKAGIFSGLTFRRPEPAYKRPSLNLLKRPAPSKTGAEFTQTVLRGNARLLEDVGYDGMVVEETKDDPFVIMALAAQATTRAAGRTMRRAALRA